MDGMEEAQVINGKIKGGCLENQFREKENTNEVSGRRNEF